MSESAIVVGLFGGLGGVTMHVLTRARAHWFRPLGERADVPSALLVSALLVVFLFVNVRARKRWLARHLHEPEVRSDQAYRQAGRVQGWRWLPVWRARSGAALGAFALATVLFGLLAGSGTLAFVVATGVVAGGAWAYSRWGRGVGWFLPLLVFAWGTVAVTRSLGAAMAPLGMIALCTLVAFVNERDRVLRSWIEVSRFDAEVPPT